MSVPEPAIRSAPAPAPQRPAWAGPLFLLGLVAFIYALMSHSSPEERRTRRFQRELDQARHLLLDNQEENAESVLHLVRQVINQMETDHPLAGEAWFLCGNALMVEYAKASENLKTGLLGEAAQAFDKSRELGVKEGDAPTLEWNRAMVAWHGTQDRRTVLALLEKAAPGAQDPAQAWQMIEAGYLKLTPPDLPGALRANEQIRSTPLIPEDRRALAQLNGGEILMKLGQVEEARRTLEKISSRASPEVFQKGRLLLARSYHDESRWAEAAQQWQRYLGESKPSPQDAAIAYLMLGQCQTKLEQYQEASRAWQEARKIAKSDASQAAAVFWAELRSEDAATDSQAPGAILQSFEEAFATLEQGKPWTNPWCDAATVRQAMEKSLVNLRKAAQFDVALQITGLYQRVSLPGMALNWKAEILSDKALFQLNQPAIADIMQMDARRNASQKLLVESALALEASSREGIDPRFRNEQIWKAAQRAGQARDPGLAARLLAEYVQIDPKGEKTGEGWYLLGQANRELGRTEPANEAYKESIKFLTRYAYLSRVRLAEDLRQKNQLDRAIEILEQNLQLLRFSPDPEAQRESLYILGELFAKQNQWRFSVRRLEEALERYPNNPGSLRAKYQLAKGYHKLAEEDWKSLHTSQQISAETRAHFEKQHKNWLKKCLATFQEVEKDAAYPENQNQLNSQERTEVQFWIADNVFELGNYQEALGLYSQLVKKFPGTHEGLIARGGIIRCHSALKQIDKVTQELEELKQAVRSVDDPTRKAWETWIQQATPRTVTRQ